MNAHIRWWVGVDGGGTGTRVRVADASGHEVGQGVAGPSGLSLGVASAWRSIESALHQALDQALAAGGQLAAGASHVQNGLRPELNTLAVGIGIAGVSQAQWREQFLSTAPEFGQLTVESDGFTSLLGAHAGAPGAVVAVGTGSIGLAWWPDGRRKQVGGWGFPSSDEGSGAWLGLQAMNRLQHELDGRAPRSELGKALRQACEHQAGDVPSWLASANQTVYASLARIVVEQSPTDPVAQDLLVQAGRHIVEMAQALDPSGTLPCALCGGLAEALRAHLPTEHARRFGRPLGDSAQGALWLAQQRSHGAPLKPEKR